MDAGTSQLSKATCRSVRKSHALCRHFSPRKTVQTDAFLQFALNVVVLSSILKINNLFKTSQLDTIMISFQSEVTTILAASKTFTKGLLDSFIFMHKPLR